MHVVFEMEAEAMTMTEAEACKECNITERERCQEAISFLGF
jgi:hypothetical protein